MNLVPIAKLVIIFIYAGMSATGLALMKANGSHLNTIYAVGFVIYGCAFCLWLFVILPSMALSVAFPVSAGSIVIATLLVGHYSLNETTSVLKILGAVLIIIGIAVVYLPHASEARSTNLIDSNSSSDDTEKAVTRDEK